MKCGMFNFTLDGCISEILLSKIYDFDVSLTAGYGKLNKYLAEGKFFASKNGEKFDKFIIASMQLPWPIYTALHDHYGDAMSIIDHHQKTKRFVDYNLNVSRVTWNTDMSSSKSIYENIKKVGKVDVAPFELLSTLADTYERWQISENEWSAAYALNMMFWRLSYWKFKDRYIDGVTDKSPFMTDAEKITIGNMIKKKNELMDEAVMEEIEGNSVVFFGADKDVVSDFSIRKKWRHYDYFYIMSLNYQNKPTIAIRKNVNLIDGGDIGAVVKNVTSNRTDISGGGFEHTGSVVMNTPKDVNEIIEIIDLIHQQLMTTDTMDMTDIPF